MHEVVRSIHTRQGSRTRAMRDFPQAKAIRLAYRTRAVRPIQVSEDRPAPPSRPGLWPRLGSFALLVASLYLVVHRGTGVIHDMSTALQVLLMTWTCAALLAHVIQPVDPENLQRRGTGLARVSASLAWTLRRVEVHCMWATLLVFGLWLAGQAFVMAVGAAIELAPGP